MLARMPPHNPMTATELVHSPDRDRRRPTGLLRGTRGRTRGNGCDSASHRRDPGLDGTGRRGQGLAVTYRAELSGRALKQMGCGRDDIRRA
jgi:hypothetical protein